MTCNTLIHSTNGTLVAWCASWKKPNRTGDPFTSRPFRPSNTPHFTPAAPPYFMSPLPYPLLHVTAAPTPYFMSPLPLPLTSCHPCSPSLHPHHLTSPPSFRSPSLHVTPVPLLTSSPPPTPPLPSIHVTPIPLLPFLNLGYSCKSKVDVEKYIHQKHQ